MNMDEQYNKKLIITFIIIELLLVPFIIILKNNDKNNLSNVNVVKKQELGIMYRDNNTDDYKEYNGSITEALNSNYVLNIANSKCSDRKGLPISPSNVLSTSGNTVIVKSNKTVHCTLYFDLKKIENLYDLCDRYNNMEACMAAEKNNTGKVPNLSPKIQGDMYRYQGITDIKVDNYICFGTTSKDECLANTDKYLYRIVGVTPDGQLKLLKVTFIKEGENKEFSYNDKYAINTWPDSAGSSEGYYCGLSCPGWGGTLLFKRINGISNGTVSGFGCVSSGYGLCTADGANTDIFVDNEYYDYLKSGDKSGVNNTVASPWYNIINNHEWMYGEIYFKNGEISNNIKNGEQAYEIETGKVDVSHYVVSSSLNSCGSLDTCFNLETYKWNEKVSAKIGLLYIHDYYYAYYDPYEGEETRGNGPFYYNWIYFGYNGYAREALITSRSFGYYFGWDMYSAYVVDPDGGGSGAPEIVDIGLGEHASVRPVFYLSSSVNLQSGKGTETEPFILNI